MARGVPGHKVAVARLGAVAWHFRITNSRAEPVHVVWDESSFVAADGVSRGRLIRHNTRMLDTANVQPTTPIGPGTTIRVGAVPEELAFYVPAPSTPSGYQVGVDAPRNDKAPAKAENIAPPAVTEGVGRMFIVFRSGAGERELWEQTLYLDGNAPPVQQQRPAPTEPAPEKQPQDPSADPMLNR